MNKLTKVFGLKITEAVYLAIKSLSLPMRRKVNDRVRKILEDEARKLTSLP